MTIETDNKYLAENNFQQYTQSEILAGATGEIEIPMDVAPVSLYGWLVIDPNTSATREEIFYHRKAGTSVFVYAINRTGAKTHPVGTLIVLNNTAGIYNFKEKLNANIFCHYYTSTTDVEILGGVIVDANGTETTIQNTNTSTLGLVTNSVNYIYLSGGLMVSDIVDPLTAYVIKIITTDPVGDILTIEDGKQNSKLISIAAAVGGDMLKATYDANANGIVDNSELVNGLTVETAVPAGAVFGVGDMTKSVYDTGHNGIVDNSELVNSLTVETAVPAGAVFTDTTYSVEDGGLTEINFTSAKDTNLSNQSGTNTGDQNISNLTTGPSSATDNALARFDLTTGKILQNGIVTESDTGILSGVESLDLSLTPAVTTHTPGRMRWNATEHTYDLDIDLDSVSLQMGQELMITFHNDTGFEIADGAVVIVRGLAGEVPTVVLALADSLANIEGQLFVTTMITGDGNEGMMTKFGKVRGIDTDSWGVGDTLYVSDTNPGELTNIQPAFPSYNIRMGQVVISAVDGTIGISQTTFVNDTYIDAWNGSFRETVNFSITESGGTITGTLTNTEPADNLTMSWSTGLETFDVTPGKAIVLTAGTSSVPQKNYIYIPISTKVLTLSTTEFPSDEHIKIAYVALLDATATGNDGALINQNWNDHIKYTDDNGHILHMAERIRQIGASHDSGTAGTSTIAAAGSEVYVAATSGKVYQLHKQVFPAIDTQTTGDVHIVNDFVTPYKTLTDIAGETLDSLGNTLNNSSFSFVMWGVQNKTGEESHLMINKPTGSYARLSPNLAVNDANNYSVYNIPSEFKSTGFLIARFTYTLTAGGVWALYDTENLRGFTPNTTAGGGGGGGGVTDFTALNDTPSSYSGEALKVAQVNAGETALEFVTVTDTAAIHDNVAAEISAVTEKATPVGGDWILIEDSVDSNNKKKVMVGSLPTGGGGEVNTASNAGTGGVGIVLTKVGIDLPFKSIAAGSSKITVTNDGVNDNIDIDIDESALTLSSLGGSVTDAQVPNTITLDNLTQITTRSHTALTDIGTNTHAQVDTHIANVTTNPHSVTATNVGLDNVDNTSDATKDAATATLTNKTIDLTDNTFTGTIAEFNTALSDGTFATGGGTATGTNTGDQTNITGNAATVTTNADLTGPITSSGNATSIASQTGTGTTFVMDTSPTIATATLSSPILTTPALGTPASGTMTNVTGTALGLTSGETVSALGIKSATTTVSVSDATAPTVGQVLTATSGTIATWQDAGGGSGSGDSTQTSITIGENVTAGNAVVATAGNTIGNQANNASEFIGYSTTNEYERGQSFTTVGVIDIEKIILNLSNVGSSDQVYNVEVYSDAGTTLIGTSDNSIDTSTLTTAQEDIDFTFTGLSLSATTQYWFKLNFVSGTVSTTNYAKIGLDTDSSYVGGNRWNITQAGTWTTQALDLYFLIYASSVFLKGDASDSDKLNFIGFASETVTSGNPLVLDTAGANLNQSLLLSGSEYYLSDTAGEISINPGTNSVKIGIALSDSEIEIFTGGIKDQANYVTLTGYETLTNKTLDTTTTEFTDTDDGTKKATLDTSTLPTATSNTYLFPDTDGEYLTTSDGELSLTTSGSASQFLNGEGDYVEAGGGGGSSDVFDVYMSTGYTLTGSSVILPFDTEDTDTGNNFNTTTNLYTAPADGYYQFNFICQHNSVTSGNVIDIILGVNGGFTRQVTSTSNGNGNITGSYSINLSSGDTVELRARNGGATGQISSGSTQTRFSGFCIITA